MHRRRTHRCTVDYSVCVTQEQVHEHVGGAQEHVQEHIQEHVVHEHIQKHTRVKSFVLRKGAMSVLAMRAKLLLVYAS